MLDQDAYEDLKKIEAKMMEALIRRRDAPSEEEREFAQMEYEWARMSRDLFFELLMLRSMDGNFRPEDRRP